MIERIAQLHSRLQGTISALLLVLLLWGLIGVWRGRVGRGFTATLWIAQWLITTQSILGAVLLMSRLFLAEILALHIIYGLIAPLLLPGAFAYNRGRDDRQAALLFVVITLFLLIIAGRSYETAVR